MRVVHGWPGTPRRRQSRHEDYDELSNVAVIESICDHMQLSGEACELCMCTHPQDREASGEMGPSIVRSRFYSAANSHGDTAMPPCPCIEVEASRTRIKMLAAVMDTPQ